MHSAMIVVAIVAGMAAVVIISVAPFLLPWHQRLRWLIVASTVPDPWALGAMPWSGLEEITMHSLEPQRGGLLISGSAGPAGRTRSLWLDCATNEDLANLHRSAGDGVSLLLVCDPGGAIILHGPTWSVTGLAAVPEQGRTNRPGPDASGLVRSGR